jgi:alpha-1,3-mannosylglycoprotein beta-1,4-N-acetylglucosaminyltransferase C
LTNAYPLAVAGFLTIGVPSIRRVNGHSYLLRTLASLIEHVTPAEKSLVTVIVFLADLDAEYNNESAKAIVGRFEAEISSGFIRLVRVSPDYYPQLVGLKRNFGDAPDRVKWRAKQVADFALMFSYARNISMYYLQIEDDVDCSHRFVSTIESYIEERNEAEKNGANWAMLEFSELGFIGKLFRASDLDRLARYMRLFYAEQPVDWLMKYFRLSMGQRPVYLRKPTLFQHFGVKSSFDLTKDNLLKDK